MQPFLYLNKFQAPPQVPVPLVENTALHECDSRVSCCLGLQPLGLIYKCVAKKFCQVSN